MCVKDYAGTMNGTASTPIPVVPVVAGTPPPTTTLAHDAVGDVALADQLVQAIRAGGLKQAEALVPQVLAAAKKNITDAQAALPAIKAGWTTSEFWMIPGGIVLNGLYSLKTGHIMPVELNALLGAVISVYTAARSYLKKSKQ